MAHVVAAFAVGCSGCDAKAIVQVWSCGCITVVKSNSAVEDLGSTAFGHLENCKAGHNRVFFPGFEKFCSKSSETHDRQADPPDRHADT